MGGVVNFLTAKVPYIELEGAIAPIAFSSSGKCMSIDGDALGAIVNVGKRAVGIGYFVRQGGFTRFAFAGTGSVAWGGIKLYRI